MLDIKSLIDYEDSEGQTILFHAVKKNDLKMIKELIASGANVNHISHYDSIFTLAYKNQHFDLINDYFYSIIDKFDSKIIQSLMNVVNENQFDMIEKFNLNLNRKITMPLLHKAVQEGNAELIKSLIKKGVDVNLENSHGEKALFYVPHKLKTQTIIDILSAFKEAGFNFNYQNKDGKTVGNHIIYHHSEKKTVVQFVEAYKLPINYLAKSSHQDCLLNEHAYARTKMRQDSGFFKEVLTHQITQENLHHIDLKSFKLEGNNSIIALLNLMKERNYSINTEFNIFNGHYKSTMLEVIASQYHEMFNAKSYTFSRLEEDEKKRLKKVFNTIKEKIISFKELDLNKITSNTFANRNHARPLYFNRHILFFLKDYILENSCSHIDLTLKDSTNSSVIKHCLNDDCLDLIVPFLQTKMIDYNALNEEGFNLILEIVNIMNKSQQGVDKNLVSKIFWSVIENTPMTDLKLKNNQGITLEKELSSLGLLHSFEEGKVRLEKKWLDSQIQITQPGRKIKI